MDRVDFGMRVKKPREDQLHEVCKTLGLESQARPTGLEPATSAVTGLRSNQLSYGPKCFIC